MHHPGVGATAMSGTVPEEAGVVTARIRFGAAELRPLHRGEAEPLQAVFDGMSPESRYARYLQPVPVLTQRMRDALTTVDGRDHVAWLASVGGRPAGIGRYVTVDPGAAEIAFEVADEFHGVGLGSVLLDTVTTVAAASGIRQLEAYVLESNRASRHLLSLIGLRLQLAGGLLEAAGPYHLLQRARLERQDVVRLAFAARPAAA